MSTGSHSSTVVGWREWVALPGLGVEWTKAKIDTGARTSAVHAFDVEQYTDGGIERVAFSVHPWQNSDADSVRTDTVVLDRREVRSSSGHADERLFVSLDISLAGRVVTAEVSLSNRDEMGFRMLIGREALARGFLVDPAESYLGGRPPLAMRRRNRAR
ncbi:MAG: RimK/LysX family protein [Mobilicoccus sp.]|nr:RimK/LysX family protein [Mobilicoccus sp.]